MPNVARSVEQRRQVVALLAGEGMSQRAIADAVGVNHATISRDQAANEAEQVLHNATPEPVDRHEQMRLDVTPESTTVVGRDGKQYPKPVNPNRNHAPRSTFSDKFYHALTKVQQGCNELQNL